MSLKSHREDRAIRNQRDDGDLDPIVEGARHNLTPEVATAIWEHVLEEATGGWDEGGALALDAAWERFHQVAAQVAETGRFLVDPGKVTRVGNDRRIAPPTPGKRTRTARDGDRSPTRGAPGIAAPSMQRALADRGGGAPLDEAARAVLEEALDADLSSVRVHTDRDASAAAAGIDARAFTIGADIYVGEGQLDDQLLAHEVAHTVQPIGAAAVMSEPDAPAEREAAQFAGGFLAGVYAPVSTPRAAVIQRDGGSGGKVQQLRQLLDDDDEDGAISLMGQLSAAEVNTVLNTRSLRDLAVDCFDDEEMYRGVRSMNGNLVKSLEWLFAEGTEVGYALDIIRRCSRPAEKTAVYNNASLRGEFISLCGDDEMRQVCEALGGTLKQKLDWMLGEGTSWEVVRPIIAAASDAEKGEMRADATMRSRFVDLLGDDEMRDLVLLLGGNLIDQLGWMFAEGTSWASVRMVIERQPDEGQRAAVRNSTAMRDQFVSLVGDDEMEEVVVLLGGDLRWKLQWMFAEGTNFAAVQRRIFAAYYLEPEKAAVRTDAALRGEFVSLCNDEQMAQVVGWLGGDLLFKVDWLIAEGTSWDPTIKQLITNASEPEKAATRASSTARDRFVELLGDDEMKEAVQILGGDLTFKLDWMLSEGTTFDTLKPLITAAPEPERAAVRTNTRIRDHFVSLLGDDEMKELVDLIGGDLRFKLDWMFAEGTSWSVVKPMIEAADEPGKAGVRNDPAMKARFIDLLGDDDMAEAVRILGGDLRFKLDWMMSEGTSWETIKPLIQAADEPGKAAVRGDAAMRAKFIDLLGDDEMKEAVELLGGDLRFKLDWMMGEGTSWSVVKPMIEAADEPSKAAVRNDRGMRDKFVDLLGNDEMKEAVTLLGGDLRFQLDWMFAEGTDWNAVKDMIGRADETGKAAVRGDAGMREKFIDLLGNDEMKEAVGLLGGDLRWKLDWMFGEGTDWDSVKTLIQAADEPAKAGVRNDPAMRDRFIDLLGNDEMKEAVGLLGGDLRFKLDWMMAEGTDWASVKPLIEGADDAGKAAVRNDPGMRDKFIDLLGNDEMKEAVGLLGGDLKFQLDWMFGEGTDWESVKEKIQAADEPGRAAVREDVAMRGRFIDLLGDDEMKEAVELLGGDLRFKLDWMLREGTTWAIVKPLIEAADETAKAGVRDDPTLRSQFVELLGDDEMAEAVQLLGGDLYFKLSWTLAEGTTWTAVRALLEAADEPGKARVRGDLGMRGWFVENLGDDEMAEAVSLLGGDLVFKLGWTLAEGTTWEKAKTLIEAAPQPERAAVLNDQELFDRLVGLVGNQQMQELLDLLGADLATRVRWLIRNGTDAAALTAAIHAATPEQQMGLIADSMLGQVLEIVPTNGIDLFTALTDAGRFATAMNTPLMVTELLAKPAAEVLTKLAGDPATARAAMEHMDADLSWMSPLPTRTGLSTAQRAELRVLFDATQVVTHRWKLIERRFGIDLSGRWGSTLHPGDLGRLWTLMERLPDSHIEDNSKIDNFIRNFEGGGSYGGVGGGNTTIGADGSHVEPFYADAGWKTGPDMAAFLGVPETELPGRVTSGQLETQNPSGTVMYRVKQISMLYFDHTVLHEVAHAVDDMLGKHTSIVYDWAGWEKFSEGDVRTWANHMGGWGTTRDGDDVESVKRSICSYMDSFMDNSSEIGGPSQNFGAELDASHPVKKYSTWPIVQRAGTKMFHYVRPHAFDDGSHVYIANYYYQEWYRVKSTAVAYIPRDYTRFSPDEWFADMYAEYYRQYDGTPATENLKGGNCPGAVKTWFDANVDALGRSPQTVAPSGTAPAHTSGVSGGRR